MPSPCLATFLSIDTLVRGRHASVVHLVVMLMSGALLASHVFLDSQPSYWHNRIQYPARESMMYRINDHYREGAKWLKNGNMISTNYPNKVAALKVLLAPYLPVDAQIIVERKDDQFLMRLSSHAPTESTRVSKYWFSQSDFIRVVDPPAASVHELRP